MCWCLFSRPYGTRSHFLLPTAKAVGYLRDDPTGLGLRGDEFKVARNALSDRWWGYFRDG